MLWKPLFDLAFGLRSPAALALPEKKIKKSIRLFYNNRSKVQTIYLLVDLMTGCTNDRGPTILSSLMLWKPLFYLAFGLRSPAALVLPEKKITRLFYKNRSKLQTIYLPVDLMTGCTISLKGIVQRKGPVALPSSGRKRTIWFSRCLLYTSDAADE